MFLRGRKKRENFELLLFLLKKLKLLFETAEKMITFEQNIPALIKKCEFAPVLGVMCVGLSISDGNNVIIELS